MTFNYRPSGVCAQQMTFTIEQGMVKNVSFVGGCSGNLQGIAKLVEGMNADEVISKLRGIRCGSKATSCPDQLATALEAVLEKEAAV